MKHDLAKALEGDDGRVEPSDRILQAAFFRRAPLQAGTQPTSGGGGARVLHLDERRAARRSSPR